MNNLERRRRNDAKALALINRFNWLRTSEFGSLMWPGRSATTQRASRLLKSLERRRLVVSRALPLRCGVVYVLSLGGVKALAEFGIAAKIGTDIGKSSLKKKQEWIPNIYWRHDLLTANILADFASKGATYLTEHELRTADISIDKIPDALLFYNDEIIWLEVENARKSGKHMRDLASALIAASRQYLKVNKQTVTTALLAYSNDALDELNNSIDHYTRVRNTIAESINDDVDIVFANCTMSSLSVKSIEYFEETIESQRWRIVLKELLYPWLYDENKNWVKNGSSLILDYRNQTRLVLTRYKNNVEGLIIRRHKDDVKLRSNSLTDIKEQISKSIFREVI